MFPLRSIFVSLLRVKIIITIIHLTCDFLVQRLIRTLVRPTSIVKGKQMKIGRDGPHSLAYQMDVKGSNGFKQMVANYTNHCKYT